MKQAAGNLLPRYAELSEKYQPPEIKLLHPSSLLLHFKTTYPTSYSTTHFNRMRSASPIDDVPPEILREIFNHTRYSLDPESPPSATAINNIRLTCLKFRKYSDGLLIDTIHVKLNALSLARLEQISVQEEIHIGLRAIKLDMQFFIP